MTSSSAGTPAPDDSNPQGGRPAQPGHYGRQPSYAPAVVYAEVSPEHGPAGRRRPGTVTAAAVLAFVWAGLTILSSLISMAAGSLFRSAASACAENDQSGLCASAADSETLLVVMGIALIVAAGLLIWGGVAALHGKSGKILVATSGIQVVIQIIWMIETGSIAFGIVGTLVPMGIIVLMLGSASRRWLRAMRGATF